MSPSWSDLRRRFPVFGERNYLASACLGPCLDETLTELEAYGRSRMRQNRAIGEWFDRLAELTSLTERLLGAPPGSVALRDSATACQSAIVGSIAPTGRRRRIVVSALDFHSSLFLYRAQERRGFEVIVVPANAERDTDVAALVAAIDERTALVALSLVSRYGSLVELAPIVAQARAAGAPLLVDAYQAVGIIPIVLAQLGVDVLVGGTHKWLSGSMGCAFMFVVPALAERLEPSAPGWFAHADLARFVHTKAFVDDFVASPGARRFAQGTPAMPTIYASRPGLQLALDVGVDALHSRNVELLRHLHDRLCAAGHSVVTQRERAVGSLCVEMAAPAAVVAALERRGIDVDQRRNEVLRIAPHPCTTFGECDGLVAALAAVGS